MTTLDTRPAPLLDAPATRGRGRLLLALKLLVGVVVTVAVGEVMTPVA